MWYQTIFTFRFESIEIRNEWDDALSMESYESRHPQYHRQDYNDFYNKMNTFLRKTLSSSDQRIRSIVSLNKVSITKKNVRIAQVSNSTSTINSRSWWNTLMIVELRPSRHFRKDQTDCTRLFVELKNNLPFRTSQRDVTSTNSIRIESNHFDLTSHFVDTMRFIDDDE